VSTLSLLRQLNISEGNDTMATIILLHDGQTFPLDDEIACDDAMLRQALAPFYSDLANAEITRDTVNEQMIVKVSRRAGPKGSLALAALKSAPETINPSVAMQYRLLALEQSGQLSVERLLLLQDEISCAAAAGEIHLAEIDHTRTALRACQARPGRALPLGF